MTETLPETGADSQESVEPEDPAGLNAQDREAVEVGSAAAPSAADPTPSSGPVMTAAGPPSIESEGPGKGTNRRRRRDSPAKPSPDWADRMTVSYYDVHLLHVLRPGGVLVREIIVRSAKIRQVLGQPLRRSIPPLRARQDHFELRTSELWEQAEFEAQPIIREVYEKFRGRLPIPSQQAVRARAPQTLGTVIEPVDWNEEARGLLLHAQDGPDGDYELYLWEPESVRVLRIAAPDLKRAWQLSHTRLYETVQIIPRGEQTLPIEEERSGRFGESRRTLRHKRKLFEVRRANTPTVVTYQDRVRP
jgi:hypothetical protein